MSDNIHWELMPPKDIVDRLDDMHRSKGYQVIRDELRPNTIKAIRESKEYQRYQDIKRECEQSWKHDHTTATMNDVNRACTVLYSSVLTLMKAQNADVADEFNKVCQAINIIEKKLGIDQTKWVDDKNDDGEGNKATDS